MIITNLLLDLLAFLSILSGILVITSKNPVVSVIFLISVFLNAAGYLFLLGLGFVAISYLIVYCGAIIVLFLFVLMMINIKLTDILEIGSTYTQNLPLAISVGSLFIYEILNILPFTFYDVSIFNYPIYVLNYINHFILSSNKASISSYFNGLTNQWDNSLIMTINQVSIKGTPEILFNPFLQIEVLGHNLYTYGAILLFITSIILLLAMLSPLILNLRPKY
jgi:NADH-ubiquinone oxidoreductase chain 6